MTYYAVFYIECESKEEWEDLKKVLDDPFFGIEYGIEEEGEVDDDS